MTNRLSIAVLAGAAACLALAAVLHLTSADLKHGFFSRSLGIDQTIPAGEAIDVKVAPPQPGKFGDHLRSLLRLGSRQHEDDRGGRIANRPRPNDKGSA